MVGNDNKNYISLEEAIKDLQNKIQNLSLNPLIEKVESGEKLEMNKYYIIVRTGSDDSGRTTGLYNEYFPDTIVYGFNNINYEPFIVVGNTYSPRLLSSKLGGDGTQLDVPLFNTYFRSGDYKCFLLKIDWFEE